jgi:integrase/recombinase XerD
MSAVQHYFDHLIQQEVIMVNPVSDIKIKGVKRKLLYPVLEPHELHRLYNQYDEQSLKGRRNKVVVGLLVYQGLRVSEVAQLEVKHLKLREGKIDVPGGIRRDGRMMELESHQVMDMYEYVLQVRPELIKTEPVEKPPAKMDTDWLFIREGGYPLTEGGLGNYIVQLLKNIRKLNPSIRNGKHIRASVITRWLKTRNLREVQYLAGHRYISSTENYLQNNMEELIEEINQYHPLG